MKESLLETLKRRKWISDYKEDSDASEMLQEYEKGAKNKKRKCLVKKCLIDK